MAGMQNLASLPDSGWLDILARLPANLKYWRDQGMVECWVASGAGHDSPTANRD